MFPMRTSQIERETIAHVFTSIDWINGNLRSLLQGPELATHSSVGSSSAFLRLRDLCIVVKRAPFSSRPSASDLGVRDS
jgi:hypothetical protein